MGKKDKQQEAIETAQNIDIIENVMIQTNTTQMSFSAMMAGLERGDYVIPGFQRMYRWKENQVEELAISLVRGMPIPPIYCYRNREQQIVILDGQQRVLSLYFYYIGKFLKRQRNAFIDVRKVTNGEESFRKRLESCCNLVDKKYCMKFKDVNGEDKIIDITYQNLNNRIKRKIDFAPITIVEINVDSEAYRERTLHKIFANLNIGGTPLSSQELRNGIYNCKFYEMLYDVNDHCGKWRSLYSSTLKSEVNKESKDVEMLLRMCAFKYYVKKNGKDFNLTEYKGKLTSLLDDFSEKAMDFNEKEIRIYKDALMSFFESIADVSGKNKNLALISIFTVWDQLKTKPYITKEKYNEIVSDEVYRSTIQDGTSGKNQIEKRLRSVYEHLSEYDQ